MTEPELPAIDEEPKGGVYRHLEDQPPTPEEIETGRWLGKTIDTDDDDDNGLDRL